jgi:nicotinamide riboside transporter PnuC
VINDIVWLWTILSIIGTILNAKLIKWCFPIYIVSNIGWIITDIQYGMYEQIPIWIVFIIIGIYGFWDWNKKEKSGNELIKTKIIIEN